jgi:hypothetical protein
VGGKEGKKGKTGRVESTVWYREKQERKKETTKQTVTKSEKLFNI